MGAVRQAAGGRIPTPVLRSEGRPTLGNQLFCIKMNFRRGRGWGDGGRGKGDAVLRCGKDAWSRLLGGGVRGGCGGPGGVRGGCGGPGEGGEGFARANPTGGIALCLSICLTVGICFAVCTT